MIVEASDGIQVRVSGSVPPELSLTLIHADRLAGDERLAAGTTSRSGLRTSAAVTAPTIYSRAQWGADESWRDGSPRYNSTILQAHVHHTATSNGYAQADVPAMIRSMYKYHTHSLGWSDIAYNFLVDNYGTIWEGRYGGVDQPVRGAHTLGFNNSSTGFSMIGNYESAQPSSAMLGSLAQLAAWKLAIYGRDPQGWTQVDVGGQRQVPLGQGRHPAGHRRAPRHQRHRLPGRQRLRPARQPACGHRGRDRGLDAQAQEAVPRGRQDAWLTGTLSVFHGKFKPKDAAVTYQWTRSGVAIDGAVGSSYVVTEADVAPDPRRGRHRQRARRSRRSPRVTLPEPCRSLPVCRSAPSASGAAR